MSDRAWSCKSKCCSREYSEKYHLGSFHLETVEHSPPKVISWCVQWMAVHLYLADKNVLDYWLSKFVTELRNQKGQPYPPNTVYSVCCGLQRYIKGTQTTTQHFQSITLCWFCKTLDSEWEGYAHLAWVFENRLMVLNENRLMVEVENRLMVEEENRLMVEEENRLMVEEENSLWEQCLLWDGSPRTHYPFCACGVHKKVDKNIWCFKSHRLSYLSRLMPHPTSYTRKIKKKNAGGISHRKVQPKWVVHHANVKNPQRRLVHIYKKHL